MSDLQLVLGLVSAYCLLLGGAGALVEWGARRGWWRIGSGDGMWGGDDD